MKREAIYPIRYLSESELDRFWTLEKNQRDDVILKVLYFTGCTVNELVNIRISDIDLKQRTIRIRSQNSRNKTARKVFISKTLAQTLKKFLAIKTKSIYLLSTRQSPQMTTKRVRQIVGSLCRRCRIKNATPQIFRYTHIAHAYRKNIPVDAIVRQVGLKRSRAIEIFNQLRLNKVEDAYRAFEE